MECGDGAHGDDGRGDRGADRHRPCGRAGRPGAWQACAAGRRGGRGDARQRQPAVRVGSGGGDGDAIARGRGGRGVRAGHRGDHARRCVGPRAFAPRVGRNEAFNHAGNAVSAALAGVLAWSLGPQVVFWLMGGLALCSIAATLSIDPDAIDHAQARGCPEEEADAPPPSLVRTLKNTPGLAVFALSAFAFHLANAAMLPAVGQLLAREVGAGRATSLTAACITGAQLVMVPVALVVGRIADRVGHRPIFLVGFAVLAARGALYTLSHDPAWLLFVQLLDGIGAGIFGALFPVVVASLTRGTGHFNAARRERWRRCRGCRRRAEHQRRRRDHRRLRLRPRLPRPRRHRGGGTAPLLADRPRNGDGPRPSGCQGRSTSEVMSRRADAFWRRRHETRVAIVP
ncbi:MFS transporter [Sphingomonas sp. MMS24-JH45]